MTDLPAQWTLAPLENCGEWGSGGTPTRTNPLYYQNGTIPWLIIGDLNDGFVTKAATYITEAGLRNSSAKLLPINTLLVAMYGSIGKLGITGIECATNQAIAYCKPNIDIALLKYLFYVLMSSKEALLAKGQGGAQQNINQGILKAHNIPLAPLPEQKRIANKLDSLLRRVDACQEHLKRVPQILKRFRQSVLAAATSGRLTEDWRETDNTISKEFGDFEFLDFPENWDLLRIKDIGTVKGGKRLPNGEKLADNDTGFPYIRAGQLKKGTVIAEDQKYLLPSTQKKISRYIVDAGDVYITIVGASIGDAGVIPPNYHKANLTENAAKICQLSGVVSNYLALWLRSPYAQIIIQSLIKSGAQGKLALTRINEIPVPLPSIKEQHEIVRRVEKLFAQTDRLEARWVAAQGHVGQLTPALLAKAFRGELVPQDPNDEPASVLLERIQEARANIPKTAKKSPRRPEMKKTLKKKSILEALIESGRELSSTELFHAAGYPVDADSDMVEDFFVDLREALGKNQISKKRFDDEDWFSLISK